MMVIMVFQILTGISPLDSITAEIYEAAQQIVYFEANLSLVTYNIYG